MNLSEAKSFDLDGSGEYDRAHRELSYGEQLQPCTCMRKAKERWGGTGFPSLITDLRDFDPDCELHFPWMIEDDEERRHLMRYWMAGYQVGYDTAFKTGRQSALEQLGMIGSE